LRIGYGLYLCFSGLSLGGGNLGKAIPALSIEITFSSGTGFKSKGLRGYPQEKMFLGLYFMKHCSRLVPAVSAIFGLPSQKKADSRTANLQREKHVCSRERFVSGLVNVH
jgi:hypothetical protein